MHLSNMPFNNSKYIFYKIIGLERIRTRLPTYLTLRSSFSAHIPRKPHVKLCRHTYIHTQSFSPNVCLNSSATLAGGRVES